MTRRMSCSMSVAAVRDRTKTVTRRHVDTWKTLQPGDRLTLIEKGMGLSKGEHQVVLADVEVVDVRVERLGECDHAEVRREGFAGMAPYSFWVMWADGHGYRGHLNELNPVADIECRRIEWRYL